MSKIYDFFTETIFLLIAVTIFSSCTKDENGKDIKEKEEITDIKDNEYALVKWNNDNNAYLLCKDGYLACNTQDMKQADAKVNDVFFHFTFDNQKRLTDIVSDLMTMHVVYDNTSSEIIVYATSYGRAFTMNSYDEGYNNARSNTSETAKNWFVGQLKAPIVQRAINKTLDIEQNINDNSNTYFEKHRNRQTLKDVMGLADNMNEFMYYKNQSAMDIVNTLEEKYPDLGKTEYLFAAIIESDFLTPATSSVMSLIMSWIKDIQNKNKAMNDDRYVKLNRPIILFGLEAWLSETEQTNCSFNIGGQLKAIGGVNEESFEYGVCVCEDSLSVKNSECHTIGSFTIGEDYTELKPTIPSTFNVYNLKPQTTYFYSAYCKSKNDNSIIWEDNWKSFTTNGELQCNNDAALNVISANYDGITAFKCQATATKPQLNNIESWGIYVYYDYDGLYFDNIYIYEELGTKEYLPGHYQYIESPNPFLEENINRNVYLANIDRNKFYSIDYDKHIAKTSVEIGIWAKLKGQQGRLLSKRKTQELVYNQNVSVSFESYKQIGDTYYATTSIENEDGTWRTVTMEGMIWYEYSVSIHVSGALFIDNAQYQSAMNQYQYGNKYTNGLIYSGVGQYTSILNDGYITPLIRQVTCPSGTYTIEGKKYTAETYMENWEWMIFTSNGKSLHSDNAMHYLHDRKPGLEFTKNYKTQRDIFDKK